MELPENTKYRARAGGANGDFFIPDLCGPRAVLLLVLLSELVVMTYVLAKSGLPDFDWGLLAISSLSVQWVALGSAMLLCVLRHRFSLLSVPMATVASLVVVLAVTALVSYSGSFWLSAYEGRETGGWWLLRNLLLAFVLASVALRYFYLQQQLRLQEKLELQSRLDSLRARIRPHFLFNSLNSIASLIHSRPQVAEGAVEDLAELFRASLKEARGEMTVADELRLCELYLGIEKLRFGERLQVDWHIGEGVGEAMMPSLLLQPLVENAVYHGVAGLPAGGRVAIELQLRGRRVTAAIENPVAESAVEVSGNRMALDNIEQRLRALFGTAAELRVTARPGHFRVELEYDPEQRL